MEAVMRANIVIGALAIFLIPACIYTAHTQDRSVVKSNCTVDCYEAGYKWARQRDIDDEDSCPDGDKLFYQGCIAYVGDSSGTANEADNGIGTPLPLSPDDGDDDDDN